MEIYISVLSSQTRFGMSIRERATQGLSTGCSISQAQAMSVWLDGRKAVTCDRASDVFEDLSIDDSEWVFLVGFSSGA